MEEIRDVIRKERDSNIKKERNRHSNNAFVMHLRLCLY